MQKKATPNAALDSHASESVCYSINLKKSCAEDKTTGPCKRCCVAAQSGRPDISREPGVGEYHGLPYLM